MMATSGFAIVCCHVARGDAAILRGRRDEPISQGDSGWQFACRGVEVEDESGAEVWALSEVAAWEPTLIPWLDCPAGTVVERASETDTWYCIVEIP